MSNYTIKEVEKRKYHHDSKTISGIGQTQFLWFYWSFRSTNANLSIDEAERFLWFYWNVEPSTFTRRAFVIATPKARHFDDEPSATSWTFSSASANPKERFSQSTPALQKVLTCDLVNPHVLRKNEPQKAQIMMIIIDIRKKICKFVAMIRWHSQSKT